MSAILQPVKVYLTYANQMRQSVPVMAYQCKLYYVQKGLDICKSKPGPDSDAAKSALLNELQDLEAMKQAMGEIDKDDMKFHVENFVLSVFAAADKAEREDETITKTHAIQFKRSGDFIQILSMFEGVYSDEW